MSNVIAHCKRYNLQWHFPTYAWACTNGVVPIQVVNTGIVPFQPVVYNEPVDAEGHPYYNDIPVQDNILFKGYYQSFRYFDEYRQDILDTINLPWVPDYNITGIHIRRTDCLSQPDAFPIAPVEYYKAAIDYMMERGHFQFRVYSDDPEYCKTHYIQDNYPGCIFEFREGYSDVEDFISLSQCQNIITARSTFSLMAGWFNQHNNKMVLCPSIEQHYYWHKQNRDLLTGTEYWLTQINW